MSISESSSSLTAGSTTTLSSVLSGVQGYHFIYPTPILAHSENVDVVCGFRISNKSPVVAKVSSSSLRLEREFYIMKKLYQYNDGPSHIVRPLEFINLPSGLTVAIYSDDGQSFLYHRQNESTTSSIVKESILRGLEDANGSEYDRNMCGDLGAFLRFAIKALNCLEYIHRHGVIHGEVRPASFQWSGSDDGPVKLWNFGSGSKSLESLLTTEGWRKTTNNKGSMELLQSLLMYMSPEQTGRTTYAPDHRSDIYSLGIVFFTLLTGKKPFDGGPLGILNGVLSRKISLAYELQPNIPEVLSRIIEKMTNKAPDDRYTSAHGVRSDLKECLELLKTAQTSNTESIPSFPLAQHDIASVFTLPKMIYGRQEVLSEMTFIIERCAGLYKSLGIRNSSRSKAYTAAACHVSSAETATDLASDISKTDSNPDGIGCQKFTASPSYYSGALDGSDTSSITSRIVVNNTRVTTTIVGVYGPGGIGKSTLFTEVQSTARQNGYVAISKFDSRNKVPYSAVIRSLSHILQQILSESEEEIHSFYEHLKISLGAQYSNVSLMTDFVPELKPLLDLDAANGSSNKTTDGHSDNPATIAPPSSNTHMIDDMEARTRFHNLYVEVFRAITHWRMTTLFLDDLHQADEPSLELIESLILSRVQLLIFISYRDQEVTDKLAELLENKIANVHFIGIEALGMDPLVDFLCDTLHRPRDINRDAIIPLAEIIFKRTRGNAFYVAQLLRTLERKKLIFYDWKKNEWQFDLREIEDATMLDENDSFDSQQLDFMVARLRELPRAGRAILKWASFVGDTFSWDTVKKLVVNNNNDDNDDDDDDSIVSDRTAIDERMTASATMLDNSDDEYNNDDDISSSASSLLLSSSSHRNNRRASRVRIHRKMTAESTSSVSGSRDDPISGLQAVLQEGYIMSIGADEFKWSHDRISQAAAELVNPGTRAKIHFKIAQYMMEEKTVDTFLVADHLLKCVNLLIKRDDKERYRHILIESGNKGRTTGAHRMAFAYYMCAVKLGNPETQWVNDDDYRTTLTLYTNSAALSWTVGELEQTEILLEAVFQNSRTPSDRMHAYRIQARYYFGLQLHSKGRAALFRCMDDLSDERSRLDTSEEGLASLYNEIEELVDKLGVNNILQLPACNDPSLIGTLGVMEELLTLSYWSGQKREMYYWACRILKLSLTKGPVGGTGNACMFAGLGYVNEFQKYAFAEKLGTIGISLADRHGSNQEKGRAYSLYPAFLILWNHHQRESFQFYQTGMNFSMSAGDRIYVAFHLVHICTLMFYNGYNCSVTLQEAERSYEDIHSWSASIDMNSFAMCIIRLTKALQGHTYIDTPEVFDGDDGFNDEHFLTESCKQSSNPELVLNWYESFKIIPLVLYGHLDTAVEVGYRCFRTLHVHPCHRHTRMALFYFSLGLLEKCRQDPERKDEYLKQIRANQEFVREWAVHSAINYSMYWTFVEAELAGLGESPDVLRAGRLYEDAINQAREGDWYLELCVMHEYTGAFYDRVGLRNVAYGFVKKAINMYMCHGSYGKARHVSTKFAQLLSDFNDDRADPHEVGIQTDTLPYPGGRTSPNDWSTPSAHELVHNPSNSAIINEPYTNESIPPVTTEQTLQYLDIVDMASILKSSQVMSSEVRFDALLSSMMSIIFENSGADCGAIVVRDEMYGVCAYGGQNEPIVTYDPPKPLDEAEHLVSSKIINHTMHTSESIFIHNVKKDSRFAVGTWFECTGEKSVICMPIIHKCRTVGCLLIEGTVGVFTQRHITVLSLLCQQMGISTANAFLFKSVQHATMANMRMIEMQKEALEEARRSKEAAVRATRLREIFLANMSHEIRTPFSGFYGMISLLADTELDPEQRDLVKTAKESCEMLLRLIDDLLNFSKLQAGKVSLDLSEVIIEDAVTDVVEMLIAMAIQKRINITYDIAPDVPAVVMADANRLRQIIINLLGNAIKFTHEGEIQIRCSVDKEATGSSDGDDNEVTLLFEVIDSGIGISDEQRKALFVPFSQVDGSTTRKYGGTGLGLSICLQLVTLMSGKIDVKSESSKGSNFFFSIRTTPVPEQCKKRIERITGIIQEVKGTRVLVADKHTSTVSMVQRLLPGITVNGACSVQELLACQATDYPIIVVGLFLTHDPEFQSWATHLKKFLERAQCILVMHYPTGAMGDMLGRNQHLNAAPTVSTTHNDGELQSNDFTERVVAAVPSSSGSANTLLSTNMIKENRRAVVCMAVPLRRKALLRTMVEMLHQTSSSPASTPRPIMAARASSEGRKVCDPSEVITQEERELFSNMNILAAEDNPVAQKLLYKQLTRLGFKVICANNGLEAVEAWQSHPPGYFSISFMDHHMPKCDGVEATRRIREIETAEQRTTCLPIVALTADIQKSARDICLKAGMTVYLTKPMNQKSLAEVLRRHCLQPYLAQVQSKEEPV
ncbi:hypothetical protein BDB00DRAFT_819835 [Zychaea mexicana]|uniref:uncharacterized protein n=1 Tax=Zychaea mexicana TaxID=64656 RepID=UPI0022FE1D5F|nr:uncharacterized protein BDB00DRAFT_819835 [Zychaea mexicana]KAI9494151.1 hypothetical protein BDB00DRAFT_819835 [Zychaea mexicana]